MRRSPLLLTLLLLRDAPAAAEPARSTSAPLATWWTVTASPERGALAVACKPDELVFVDAQQRVRVRPGRMKLTGVRRWEWTIGLGKPEIRCTLEREAARPLAKLTCAEGTRRQQFSLREADAQRARELAALAAKNRPAKDVCVRAEACCPAAFSLLHARCNPDLELGRPRQPDQCDGFLKGIRMILQEQKLKPPPACLP